MNSCQTSQAWELMSTRFKTVWDGDFSIVEPPVSPHAWHSLRLSSTPSTEPRAADSQGGVVPVRDDGGRNRARGRQRGREQEQGRGKGVVTECQVIRVQFGGTLGSSGQPCR